MTLLKDLQLPKGTPERIAQLGIVDIRAVHPIDRTIISGQERFEFWVLSNQASDKVESSQDSRWRPIERRSEKTFGESG